MPDIETYTQPNQPNKEWTEGRPDGSLGPYSPGIDCIMCGEPGHAHVRERVYPDDGPAGAYYYRLRCPE